MTQRDKKPIDNKSMMKSFKSYIAVQENIPPSHQVQHKSSRSMIGGEVGGKNQKVVAATITGGAGRGEARK